MEYDDGNSPEEKECCDVSDDDASDVSAANKRDVIAADKHDVTDVKNNSAQF